MKGFGWLTLFLLLNLAAAASPDTEPAWFDFLVVDNALPGAYQVAMVDINRDGRLDLAALGEGENTGVYWYENPSWTRYPISGSEIHHPIDLAFYDLDGDGDVEMALASDFDLNRSKVGGTISWFDRTEDVHQPWKSYLIHAEPTAHRLRWAQFAPGKPPVLVVAPIVGVGSSGPNYDQTAIRLLAFTIPPHPRQDPWPMEILDVTFHLVHGLFVHPLKDGREAIFTAGLEGIHRFLRAGTGQTSRWEKALFGAGAPKESGRTGASELVLGHLHDGREFIAAVEPWHGNQVAVYTAESGASSLPWTRAVLDESFVAGHALACADWDQDGEDEIIAGYRGEGHTIYLYDRQGEGGNAWTRITLSTGVAAQGFAVGDVNADGWLDFAANGGSTHNVTLFFNRGAAAHSRK